MNCSRNYLPVFGLGLLVATAPVPAETARMDVAAQSAIESSLGKESAGQLLRSPRPEKADWLKSRLRSRGLTESIWAKALALPADSPTALLYADESTVNNMMAVALDTSSVMIYLGDEAWNRFPECVSIGDGNRCFASGILVGPNLVLTAAHGDIPAKATEVRVGFTWLTGTRYKVKARRVHAFDPATYRNDLALLLLETNVTGVSALPIKVAAGAMIDTATDLTVAGFGSDSPLGIGGGGKRRFVTVPRFNGDYAFFGSDRTTEVIAIDPVTHKDSCAGDSGGPAYVKQGGNLMLAALVSRAAVKNGVLNTTCGDGGIYARVDCQIGWITSAAAALGGTLALDTH